MSEIKRRDLPTGDHCPDHPDAELDAGYGLAGGGMGPYMYCSVCYQVISKTQDQDHDYTDPSR